MIPPLGGHNFLDSFGVSIVVARVLHEYLEATGNRKHSQLFLFRQQLQIVTWQRSHTDTSIQTNELSVHRSRRRGHTPQARHVHVMNASRSLPKPLRNLVLQKPPCSVSRMQYIQAQHMERSTSCMNFLVALTQKLNQCNHKDYKTALHQFGLP